MRVSSRLIAMMVVVVIGTSICRVVVANDNNNNNFKEDTIRNIRAAKDQFQKFVMDSVTSGGGNDGDGDGDGDANTTSQRGELGKMDNYYFLDRAVAGTLFTMLMVVLWYVGKCCVASTKKTFRLGCLVLYGVKIAIWYTVYTVVVICVFVTVAFMLVIAWVTVVDTCLPPELIAANSVLQYTKNMADQSYMYQVSRLSATHAVSYVWGAIQKKWSSV